MDDELKDFIAKNRKRKSVFDEFRDDIFLMIDNQVSQANIVEYIKKKVKKGTKGLAQPNLSEWLKRQKKRNKSSPKNNTVSNDTDSSFGEDNQGQNENSLDGFSKLRNQG